MPGIRGRSFNKGEWAELYVMIKLLGDGRLYAADNRLRRKPDSYLEILKVLREEIEGMLSEYSPDANGQIEIRVGGELLTKVPASDFRRNARIFFDYLESSRGSSMPAPDVICDFAEEIYVSKPKSPAMRGVGNFGGKTDITITLRDGRNSMVSTMGFSIKSQFSHPPTLYNAGTSSQLLFRMEGMDDALAEEFNSLVDANGKRRWSDCMKLIANHGIDPVYIAPQHETLGDNLFFVSDSMPDVLAWLYRESILIDRSCCAVSDLCARMKRENPLRFRNVGVYEKRIKDFLFASFSGMTASRPWNGEEQVNGGYIVVKPDGEVLCYHANDREDFRDYLFENTYIEYVSCRKYRWGYVYRDEKLGYVLPVNASVRFVKNPCQ